MRGNMNGRVMIGDLGVVGNRRGKVAKIIITDGVEF